MIVFFTTGITRDPLKQLIIDGEFFCGDHTRQHAQPLFPFADARLRNKEIEVSLIVDRMRDVLRVYDANCNRVEPL